MRQVPVSPPRARVLYDACLGAALVVLTFIVYWPSLRGGLLWDDDHHLTPPALRSLHGLWRIWSDPGATQQYYPLLHSAFWLEHRIWGDALLGYHLATLSLHAAAALLVVMIARRLQLPGAWLAGFVFAVHPMCVEAVAWISEQKSTLSAVLYLGAALAWLRFDRTRGKPPYAAASFLFVLALMAKTVTATLPAALLVVVWYQRGRVDWKRDVLPLVPWFAVGVPAGIFTAWMEKTSIGAQGSDFALSLLQRFLLAGHAICFYAGKILLPVNLTFSYPHWKLDTSDWRQYIYLAVVAAVTVGLWLAARRYRGPLAGFLFFVGTLFPVLGFLNVYPFRFSYVADHFQYLASLGIILPIVAGLTIAAGQGRLIAGTALVVALGAMTWQQSKIYRDSETLYRATLARNPSSWMGHTNLCAVLLARRGGIEEAIAECQAALRYKPDYAEAHNDLGSALAAVPGRLADATAEFREAVRDNPDFAAGHFNLANALARTPDGKAEAISEYHEALRLRPEYVEALMNLGTLYLQMPGRLPAAVAEFEAAVRMQPDLAETHNNLGSALARLPGRLPDAIREFQAALRLDSAYAKAHNNLGSVLVETPGRLMEAIAAYQAAIRTNPDYADAHYNLALAWVKAGRPEDAIAELRQTVRADPENARAHYNLAILLLRLGRAPEAIAEFETTLAIRRDPELRKMVDRLRSKR